MSLECIRWLSRRVRWLGKTVAFPSGDHTEELYSPLGESSLSEERGSPDD
jgi:hypothetical protein